MKGRIVYSEEFTFDDGSIEFLESNESYRYLGVQEMRGILIAQ